MKIYAWGCWFLWFLFSSLDFRLGWVLSRHLEGTAFENNLGLMLGMLAFVLGAGVLRWTFLWRQVDRKNWVLMAGNMALLASFSMGALLVLAIFVSVPEFPCRPEPLIASFLAGGVFGTASGFPLISMLGRPLSHNAAV